LGRITGDLVFRIPAVRLGEAQSEVQRDTYMYLFTWPSPLMGLGACHALEIPFVFGNLGDPLTAMFAGEGSDAEALSRAMQEAWLAFARTGRPQHAGIPDWPRYDASRRATMLIGKEWTVEDDPFAAERQWWDDVL
jgi:para-nitrobenzyl esterase